MRALLLLMLVQTGPFDASIDEYVAELKKKPPPIEIPIVVPWQHWRESQNVEDRRPRKKRVK
jgi:hypothetical protein